MTTMIEKSLERMAAYRDELETKLDKISNISPELPALVDGGLGAIVSDLMAAATADTLTKAAALLRALHEPVGFKPSPHHPFGKPASSNVIDAEFTEIKPGETPDGAA